MTRERDLLSFCGQEVRRLDPDRFFCALFAPAEVREDLFALYVFNLEIARVRELVSQPILGEIRLQWWRDAIASVYAGSPREHATLRALAAAIGRHDLPCGGFEALIDARAADLDDGPPADLKALEAQVDATAMGLVRMALAILGSRTEVADAVARHVGIGFGLAGLLRSTAHLARSGRVVLPGNVMRAEGITAADVLAGRASAGLARTVAAVAELAHAHLIAARHLGGGLPGRAVSALLPASLASSDLHRLALAGHNPFSPLFVGPGIGRKLMATFRALCGRF